jgi:hypothetical protein
VLKVPAALETRIDATISVSPASTQEESSRRTKIKKFKTFQKLKPGITHVSRNQSSNQNGRTNQNHLQKPSTAKTHSTFRSQEHRRAGESSPLVLHKTVSSDSDLGWHNQIHAAL